MGFAQPINTNQLCYKEHQQPGKALWDKKDILREAKKEGYSTNEEDVTDFEMQMR